MRNNVSPLRCAGSTSTLVFLAVLIFTTAVSGDALRTRRKSTTKIQIPMPTATTTRNTDTGDNEKLAMVIDVIPARAVVVEIPPPAVEISPADVVRTPPVGENPKSLWGDKQDSVMHPFAAKPSLDPVQPSKFLNPVNPPDGKPLLDPVQPSKFLNPVNPPDEKPSLKPLKPVRSTRPSTDIAFVTPPLNVNTRAVNYQYNTDFNIALDVATCQSSMINSSCPKECNGVSINGECACPACGVGSAIDSSLSLAKTIVSAHTKTTLSTAAFILDIDANVFSTGPGEVQVDVYKHKVSFGAAKNQVQISDVLILRPTAVSGFITITMKYDTNAIYPGWAPRVLKMNPITWLWEDASRSYTRGDGAIYFKVDRFDGQFVVVASSATDARLNPRAFYGRICECEGGREVSMPCSFHSDVVCTAPRAYVTGSMHKVTVEVKFPSLNSKSLDEYLYRVALARLMGIDFRDVIVSSVTLVGDDASLAVPGFDPPTVVSDSPTAATTSLAGGVVSTTKTIAETIAGTTSPVETGSPASLPTEVQILKADFPSVIEISNVGSTPGTTHLGDGVMPDPSLPDHTIPPVEVVLTTISV